MTNPNHRSRPTSRRALALALTAVLAVAGGTAVAQDLESERAAKQAELEEVKAEGEVLSSEISEYTEQITQLEGEVAILRNREAVVAQHLRETEARLLAEKENLIELRAKLDRSLDVLAQRLIDIYKSDEPDALTVLLDSDGFDDLVNRYDYLTRIQDQDAQIVDRVTLPAQRVARGGRADPSRQARDRGQEGRARAHPHAARGPRGRARRGARPEGRGARPGRGDRTSGSRATSPT